MAEQDEATFYEALLRERARRNAEEERETLPHSLSKFIAAGWHVIKPEEEYLHNWHIDAICEYLEAVSRGEIRRLQVWIPPGTMKTGTVSVFWPAWEWTTRPWLRYWTASYETRLAGRMSTMARDLMMSEWFQERWGGQFKFTREGEHYYGNDRGGTRLATAPNSTGSGEHGHRIIIDDPINAKAADATSRTTLNEVREWYDGTVVTRGIGTDHARVLVMQRLHESDLAAHMLDVDEWEVLCLPERYEANHPHVWPRDPRKEGELIWPEIRDEKLSKALEHSLRSKAAGQLQQRPAPREGEILKRDWWRFYDARIRAQEDWNKLGRFGMIVISVDTPLKDKETNDNVAVQCWGVKGADRYLLDLRLGRMNYGLAKRTIREMALWSRRIWRGCPHYVLIENAGYGVELIIDLKRELTGVTKISPGKDGDKISRAEAASDGLESGNYFLPGYGQPWQPAYDEHKTPADVREFIGNAASFPNAVHDDDVDAWSQVGNWLRSKAVQPIRTSQARRRLPSGVR